MIEALLASKLLVVGGKGDLIQPWIVLELNDLRLVASQSFLPISLLGYFGCQKSLRVHESRAGHVSRRARFLDLSVQFADLLLDSVEPHLKSFLGT